jgi:1-acyl-sn-glycerol-3-phosphate acyltransferase
VSRWLAALGLAESALLRLVARVHVEGSEHIPRSGPCVIAANHRHILDGALFALLVPAPIFIFGAAEWVERPWVKPFLLVGGGGVIPVRRRAGDTSAVTIAIQTLRQGTSVLITPQGGVTKGSVLGRGHSGVVRIATAVGAPIVPLGIHGQERLPGCLWRLRRADIWLRFGPPVHLNDSDDVGDNVDLVMRSIAARLPLVCGGTRA